MKMILKKDSKVFSFDGTKRMNVNEIFNIETDKSNLFPALGVDSGYIFFEEWSKILGEIFFFTSLGVPFSVG